MYLNNINYSHLLEPTIIEGGDFNDRRGKIEFVNDFKLDDFKRFYTIHHKKLSTIRAWQAHQFEQKVFFPLEGFFIINLIKIDNWKTPNSKTKPYKYLLTENSPKILIVPGGYANGFINSVHNSKLLIFSSCSLDNSISDNYRFDKDYFINSNWNVNE